MPSTTCLLHERFVISPMPCCRDFVFAPDIQPVPAKQIDSYSSTPLAPRGILYCQRTRYSIARFRFGRLRRSLFVSFCSSTEGRHGAIATHTGSAALPLDFSQVKSERQLFSAIFLSPSENTFRNCNVESRSITARSLTRA